jgi:hypothetical protein
MFNNFAKTIKKLASSFAPQREGYVRLTIQDAITGEILDKAKLKAYFNIISPGYLANTATYGSRKGLAHLLVPNDNDYKLARIEWGSGHDITDRANTDLAAPFTPAVYTSITGYSFPTADENVLKISTTLTNETLSTPQGSSYPYIREVALRSNPTQLYPKGLMFARFVADADIPKTSNAINIALEWLYIFN